MKTKKVFFAVAFLVILLTICFLLKGNVCANGETSNATSDASASNASVSKKAVKIQSDYIKDPKERWKEIEKNVFPLTSEEIFKIRKLSELQRKILEEEKSKKGQYRVIYYDDAKIEKIYVSVNYVTTICFWKKLDKDGFIVGSESFKVEITDNEKCVAIFPQLEFKESNIVAMVDGRPLHFLLREVYDESTVDVNVLVKKKPEFSKLEILKMIATGVVNEDVKALLKEFPTEADGSVLRKYFYDGLEKFYVLVVKKDKKDFFEKETFCVDAFCYVIVEAK